MNVIKFSKEVGHSDLWTCTIIVIEVIKLTLVLMNPDRLANSVDSDQLASTKAN